MARTGRPGLSGEKKRELSIRWKQGQSRSNEVLGTQVKASFVGSDRTYGARRV